MAHRDLDGGAATLSRTSLRLAGDDAGAAPAGLASPGRSARHVLHLVDTLDIGGAEQMAVNLANAMPRPRYRVTLCTTRRDGPLADGVAADVTRLRLARRGRFDLGAVRTLADYLRTERVDLLHAHGTSLFIARLAAGRLAKVERPALLWHDHFGRYATEERPRWLYRWATSGIGGVMAVNTALVDWSRRRLGVPDGQSWYVPNFVFAAPVGGDPPELPGGRDRRVVCVANLRPQKDHLTLVRAMGIVVQTLPDTHLLLVGSAPDAGHLARVRAEIQQLGLDDRVAIVGPRNDVPSIIRHCAVGVLSSSSEGLPLALIEYGMAGLPAIGTDVGECAAVLDHGRAGLLVPPRSPGRLADALLELLRSPVRRSRLGSRLQAHVERWFGPEEGVRRVGAIYDAVLRG
ncbi:MAG: glycosyltransferase [Vicinamibacterales bacterium]